MKEISKMVKEMELEFMFMLKKKVKKKTQLHKTDTKENGKKISNMV